MSARFVARNQPVKLAALEGQFRTQRGAPLRIGGLPDPVKETTRYAIEIPRGLSLLAFNDPDAEVVGLSAFPRDERPNPVLVHLAFQVMVACGIALAAVGAAGAILGWKRRERFFSRPFLRAVVACGPLGLLAVEAGWVVTELGRQPWVIHKVMRTSDAVTPVGGLALPFVFFTLFYLALGFFAGASLFTPFLLGVVLGAVSTRGVRADGLSSIAGGTGAWLALFPLSAGGMTLSSSAYLALGERHRAGGGSVLTPPLLGGFPSESVRTANPVQTARIYEVSNANPVGGGRQLTFSVPNGGPRNGWEPGKEKSGKWMSRSNCPARLVHRIVQAHDATNGRWRMSRGNTDRIEEKILLRVPRARVWRALTNAEEFGAWFGVKLAGAFAPGASVKGTITEKGYEGMRFELVVDRIEPQHLFSWRWHPYAVDPEVDYSHEPPTLVVCELEEVADGTVLTLVESGFDGVPAARRAEAYRMHVEGWAAQMKAIEQYLVKAA